MQSLPCQRTDRVALDNDAYRRYLWPYHTLSVGECNPDMIYLYLICKQIDLNQFSHLISTNKFTLEYSWYGRASRARATRRVNVDLPGTCRNYHIHF